MTKALSRKLQKEPPAKCLEKVTKKKGMATPD